MAVARAGLAIGDLDVLADAAEADVGDGMRRSGEKRRRDGHALPGGEASKVGGAALDDAGHLRAEAP